MAKNKQTLDTKSENDIVEMVATARETLRVERFKDTFSRKASVIKKAKLEVAQALTELTKRRNLTAQ